MPSSSSRICCFVRHGQSESNISFIVSSDREGYPLTQNGRAQIAAIGKELKKIQRLDSLYTSPVLRARQSADIVSEYVGIKPVIDDLLWERNMMKQNNMKFKSRDEMREVGVEQIRLNYPDRESWKSMGERMDKFSERIKAGEVAIAVSHSDPIKALVGLLLGQDETYLMDNPVTNGSVTIIDLSKTGKDAILAFGSMEITDDILQKLS